MSVVLDVRPAITTTNEYGNIYAALNTILNDERFGNSAARITPRLDQIEQVKLPLNRMWVITRENFTFNQVQLDLLFQLVGEQRLAHQLLLSFQI